MALDNRLIPLRHCPKEAPTEAEQNWYRLPTAPALGICSRCYTDKLANTPFAAHFKLVLDTSGLSRFCDFHTPRVQELLHQALKTGEFSIMRDYLNRRNQIQRCKGGGVPFNGDGAFVWYQLSDATQPADLHACGACYEDYIVAGGFSSNFTVALFQHAGQTRQCDLAWSFSRKLVSGGGGADWAQIVGWMQYRKTLPLCAGAAGAQGTSRMWFNPRFQELNRLATCEACYYDVVYQTVAQDTFGAARQALPETLDHICVVGGTVPLRIALDESIVQKNINIFHRAATAHVRNPLCTPQGISQGLWYSILPAQDEFDVCASCYSGIFESLGVGHFLAPKQVPPGPRMCDLNLQAPLMAIWIHKIEVAIERQNVEILSSFVNRVLAAPPCPEAEPVTGKIWYTHDMFSCCPSCWLTAPIEGTKLANAAFAPQPVEVSHQLKCDFYSARVRSMWKQACIDNDLPGFVAVMQQRLGIWQRTYPLIQQHLQMMRINAMRQQTLFMASTINMGANSIAAASGSVGNFGNSQIGWGYETYAGAEGATQFNQAVNMNTENGGNMMSIVQLEAMWKEVE